MKLPQSAKITRYSFGTHEDRTLVHVELMDEKKGLWAVFSNSFALNTDGDFEYQPMPSNRSDPFKRRTRWELPEALKRAEAAWQVKALDAASLRKAMADGRIDHAAAAAEADKIFFKKKGRPKSRRSSPGGRVSPPSRRSKHTSPSSGGK